MIPKCLQDLTPAWFSQILSLGDKNQGDKHIEYKITSNAGGVGYLSSLFRVEIVNSGHQTIKYKNLIIKLLPEPGSYLDVMIREEYDQTEISFYQLLLPELIKKVPFLQKYFCACLYANTNHVKDNNRASVLVLEDLKPYGFKILGFTEEFSMDQVLDGVDFLAKLASSAKLLEHVTGATILELFPQKIFPQLNMSKAAVADKWRSFYTKDATFDFPKLDNFIRTYSDPSSDILQAHDYNPGLCSRIFDILEAVIKAGQKFPSIIHNDLWRCNMLVRSNSNQRDESLIKIIDWQTVDYLDSTFDLATYLLSTLPIEKISRKVLDEMVVQYFNLYSAEFTERGILMDRNRAEFTKFFNTYAMSYAYVWFANSYESNYGMLPDYLVRLSKVISLLYSEYEIHVFVKDMLFK